MNDFLFFIAREFFIDINLKPYAYPKSKSPGGNIRIAPVYARREGVYIGAVTRPVIHKAHFRVRAGIIGEGEQILPGQIKAEGTDAPTTKIGDGIPE